MGKEVVYSLLWYKNSVREKIIKIMLTGFRPRILETVRSRE